MEAWITDTPLMKPKYVGKALTFEEQIRLLQSQGLIVEDHARAMQVLRNISYARLKNYLIPLMADRKSHRFRKGATFEMAYVIYGFDRRLRELIFHEMEKIEISFRTRFAYATAEDGDGYWFLEDKYFKSSHAHGNILHKIGSEIRRTDNEGIVNFRAKFSNPFPPCWLTMEATTIGTLAIMYEELREGRYKDKIAGYYGVDSVTLESWLKHLVYVRNYCAHHSRLWNKPMETCPLRPRRATRHFPVLDDLAMSRVYSTLCVIKYLQNTIKPNNTFGQRLKSLIGHYDTDNIIDTRQMGFPENWEEDPLWEDLGR